jgi:UDP-3-O-[3-hydroxymyristoyl] glucosamine N-acyltransferase
VAAVTRPIALSDIAAELGLEVEGDGQVLVTGVAALDLAGPGDIAFVRSASHAELARGTGAAALILPADVDPGARPVIRSNNPALDFARVVERFGEQARPAPGIDPSVSLADDCEIDPSASLAPGVVVGAGCRVGARSVLHPNVTLYRHVVVGADCLIHARVVLREGTRIGDRVRLQPGVVIGGDGFGYVGDEDGARVRVPHVGHVVIEDDVEIGANTTVDRATLGETRIRRGTKIDNLVQIAHNCEIGEDVIIAAQSGVSGSTKIGAGAVLMAQSGIAGHLDIGEQAFVGARAGLHKDVRAKGRVWGSPQLEGKQWHRAMAAFARLPDMLRRLRAVERMVGLRPKHPVDGDGDDAGRRGTERER